MKLKNKKGISLIELVMLIAIIGIMSAISIVSLATAKLDSELETAAEEVVAVLREAQNYSLTGKSISSNCGTYMVNFTNGSSNYILTNGPSASGCLVNQSYTLKNGVVIHTASSVDVSFEAPHAKVIPVSSPPAWITLRIRKGAYSSATAYTICVNQAGLIKKLKGTSACT